MACCPFSMKNNLSPSQHNASSSTPSAADRQSSVHQFEEEDISVLNCKNLNQAINILIRPSVSDEKEKSKRNVKRSRRRKDSKSIKSYGGGKLKGVEEEGEEEEEKEEGEQEEEEQEEKEEEDDPPSTEVERNLLS
ncbi:hypothetical protein M8J76_003903 [Diaphorina citri]|nr:hypothetical protein M8J76_003903 [Diaphorina citri]